MRSSDRETIISAPATSAATSASLAESGVTAPRRRRERVGSDASMHDTEYFCSVAQIVRNLWRCAQLWKGPQLFGRRAHV